MKKIPLYLLFIVILISGCEKPDRLNNDTKNPVKQKLNSLTGPNDTNKIKTGIYKGIFSNVNDVKTLAGCENGKKVLIADGSETAEIERIFDEQTKKNTGKGIYIEAEGFISSQSGKNGKGMDSVLIISRVLKYEKKSVCN